MRILFLGDIVGASGCKAVKENLPNIIEKKKLDFVVVNGENAADQGVGITQNITEEILRSGVDVITSGNHIWDQKETYEYIENQNRLLRPLNLVKNSPGIGFSIYNSKKNFKVGVLNLMGNIFMKKCDDVFNCAKEFLSKYKLKSHYDFLIVDFHAEITSEKMAMGHLFDGFATLVVGTHTHVPTNDARVMKNGTAYLTDAGMCGVYDSVIGMNAQNSLNKFFKKESTRHFPSKGEASLCGAIVDCDQDSGLANNINSFVYGGDLKNTN